MSLIKMRCIDQVLTYEATPLIASGDKGVDFVKFDFCEKWEGYSRVGVFWRNEDEPYAVNLSSDDTCEIPKEVLTQEGVIYMGAFGVDDLGNRRTSQVLSYRISKGAWSAGSVAPDPSPDVYDQLLALYVEMGEKYTEVTEAMPFKADLVDGKVPASQLPSFVDDVLEFADRASFPATGESGKLYVDLDKNLTYRWGGSTYVEVSASLALGETASTAHRGDHGAAAYAHSLVTGSNPHGTTAAQVGAVPDTRTVNGVRLNKDIRLPIIVAAEEEPDDVQDGDVWLDLSDTGIVDNDTATAALNLICTILEKAVYTENVSGLLEQLKELLENGEPVEPEVTLVRISATYSGGSVPVGTAVSALTGIKVTAHYSDGSTATVTGYTVSGTIKEGSNAITVSYGGKTATLTVTGVAVEEEADVSQVGKVLIVKSGVTVTKSGNVLNIA